MPKQQSIEQAVIGELLPDVGKRTIAMAGDQKPRHAGAGGQGARTLAGLEKNLSYVPQSVVKRVAAGGTHSAKELRRQVEYITRDEANVASWSNQIGIERSFDERGIDGVVAEWSQSWVGAPRRGHTDHIILSFPKGTNAETAEHVARDWGQEVFGSGFYEDRFRYVAAMHHNTEQVHAHFIVDKVGMDEGKFLSIGKFSEINYAMMRELHADIAADHGLALNATPRLSRGLVENSPRESDIQTAREEGRVPHIEPLSYVERTKREAIVRGYSAKYDTLAKVAMMNQGGDVDSYLSRVIAGAQSAAVNALEGSLKMNNFADPSDVPAASIDPAGRIMAARESMIAQAQSAWMTIREMEPGQDRVEMETAFAEQAKATAHLFPENDFLRSHTQKADVGDNYSVGSVAAISARAGDETNPLHAQADKALGDFREGLERSFSPYANRFEDAGTTVEEMAARFVIADRTEAQLEAWRPDDPSDRSSWVEMEKSLQADAIKLASSLSVGRELQVELAKQGLLEARGGERLADIEALDKLVMEVRADLSDGDMDRIANGSLDPLTDQIRDPGVRSAVGSELRNVASVEEGRDVSGRDSDSADRYRNVIEAHDRAADRQREGRGRDDVGTEYSI
jgi:type IV secretion system T-DNA border endonuclease VirD2